MNGYRKQIKLCSKIDMFEECKNILNLCQSCYPAVIMFMPLFCSDSELLRGVKPDRACESSKIIHNEIFKINFLII